jgi:sialic acid synthase SpsE
MKIAFLIHEILTSSTVSNWLSLINSIRPSYGLVPKEIENLIGKKVIKNIKKRNGMSVWRF